MGPYSHFILAAQLAPHLQPEPAADFYWGAIVPDIRYLANMRREQTHLNQERLRQLKQSYPQFHAFLLGYEVHCLIDRVDLTQCIGHAFPLNLLQRMRGKPFSQEQLTILAEMTYLQKPANNPAYLWEHNPILDELGITPDQTALYAGALSGYIRSHSMDTALAAFQAIGMINHARFEKYQKAYHATQGNFLINTLFRISMKTARLEQRVKQSVLPKLNGEMW